MRLFPFKVRQANWLLLALLLACAKSALDWGFTYWQAYFLDGLTARDQGRFWSAMAWLPAVLVAEALLSSGTTLANARSVLQSRARAATAHGTLLIPGALIEASKHPDLVQTVVEDVRTRAELEVSLSTGFAASLFTAALFSGTLAAALPTVHVEGLTIPAPMLWIALALFGVTSFAMHRVGHALPEAETLLAQFEARLRSGIARLRENAMAAAVLGGSNWERAAFERALGAVKSPALRIAAMRARLQALGTFFGPSDLLVLLLLSPFYFAGQITFGQLFQAGMAHRGVGMALDWFVHHYADWARWKATTARISEWERLAEERDAVGGIERCTSASALAIRSVELRAAGGATALPSWQRRYPDFRIAPGQRAIISAPSGFGKTTLFAAIAGTWRMGSGKIDVPDGLAVVPQRHYFPSGTLAEALCYPAAPTPDKLRRADELLRAFGLEHLRLRLHEESEWSVSLSGGEAARAGLVRALLAQPRWLLLDEPVANLDATSAAAIWSYLRSQEDIAIAVICHGPHGLGKDVVEVDLGGLGVEPAMTHGVAQ